SPATVLAGLDGMLAIAEGDAHRVALKFDGTVWTWGADGANQLGNGGTLTEPAPIPGVNTATAIAAGFAHTSLLLADGTVKEFGNYSPTPRVFTATDFTSLAGGDFYTIALKSDGTVWTWLFDETPAQVPGLTNMIAIAAGGSLESNLPTDLALQADGSVWAWDVNSRQPARLATPTGVTAIASGATAAALTVDGSVW